MADLTRRTVKMVDIVYVSFLYTIPALLVGIYIDSWYGPFNEAEYDAKSFTEVIIDVCLHMSLVAITAYAARNIIPLIPFPLDGVQGYKHLQTKEVSNALFYGIIIMAVQPHLQAKLKYLHKRVRRVVI